jgi:hypothetical protein
MTGWDLGTTVPGMDTRKHEKPTGEPTDWGAEPFSWLRKRNQRRDRVAQVMQDTKARRNPTRGIPAQREHNRRHAG